MSDARNDSLHNLISFAAWLLRVLLTTMMIWAPAAGIVVSTLR